MRTISKNENQNIDLNFIVQQSEKAEKIEVLSTVHQILNTWLQVL
jgi:hypothetical protein